MSGIEIRVSRDGDAAVLGNVSPDVFDNAIKPELAEAYLAEPLFHLVVALDGDKVVGMASGLVHFHPDKQPEFLVNEVGVDDAYLRRGIGTRLMSAILEAARGAGCREVWLGTEAANAVALGLYRSIMREGDAEEAMSVFTYRL
ncbi:MAG TPA: GNAT family N-acetyltransferase [Devosiaceae bacterium]|nr:GNAT family N-acetyltransferase [Devosiaceae bacterium]